MEDAMETTPAAPAIATPEPEPTLSLLERAIAVFVRPARAWPGLRTRAQWCFPLLVVILVNTALTWAVYDRALVPTQVQAIEDQVASGQIPADRAQQIERDMSGPTAKAIALGSQVVVFAILYFITGARVWFGAGFVLGSSTPYRLALEVVCWSGLITIPAQIIAMGIAWSRESMRGLHVGFGLLLPQPDTPSRLHVGLAAFLDALGPLSIWYLVVMILGAAALSGAPRRSVAWVLSGLYLVLMLLLSALGAMFTPAT
jgi:hypothetical protein